MLTDSEKAWLRTRDKKRPYCFYCDAVFGTDSCYWKCVTEICAMYPDMKDAAEFSERVAAKLVGITESMMQSWACPANENCAGENCAGLECREVLLRYARLQVEEEMDANGK